MPSRSRSGFILPALGLIAALVWAMVRSGFIMTPVPEDLVQAAAIWPERTESWMTQFYTDSPLYIITARALGLVSEMGIVRQGLVVGIIGLLALAFWAWRLAPHDQRNRAARLVVLAPVGAVLFAGLGSYDPFTVLAWAATLWLWLTGSRWALVAGGVLLGIQHFEQAVLGTVALWLVWKALESDLPGAVRRLPPWWILPGIVAGKAALVAVLVASGQTATGRTEWLGTYVAEWTKIGVAAFPSLLWSFFAGLWLLAFFVWTRTARNSRWLLVGAFALGVLGTVLSGDRPRVFVLILLPGLMLAILRYLRSADSPVEARAVEVLAWLAPPAILAGKITANTNIFDNGYVSFMWITGLGGPG